MLSHSRCCLHITAVMGLKRCSGGQATPSYRFAPLLDIGTPLAGGESALNSKQQRDPAPKIAFWQLAEVRF